MVHYTNTLAFVRRAFSSYVAIIYQKLIILCGVWILVSLFDKVSHPQIKYYGLNFAYTKKKN